VQQAQRQIWLQRKRYAGRSTFQPLRYFFTLNRYNDSLWTREPRSTLLAGQSQGNFPASMTTDNCLQRHDDSLN
jgi:hypothetical protein